MEAHRALDIFISQPDQSALLRQDPAKSRARKVQNEPMPKNSMKRHLACAPPMVALDSVMTSLCPTHAPQVMDPLRITASAAISVIQVTTELALSFFHQYRKVYDLDYRKKTESQTFCLIVNKNLPCTLLREILLDIRLPLKPRSARVAELLKPTNRQLESIGGSNI